MSTPALTPEEIKHANVPTETRYRQFRVNENQSYEDYQTTLDELVDSLPEKTPFFVYIGAANDPATHAPWCGDCRRANPIVHAALDRAFNHQSNLTVLNVFLNRAPYKDLEHPHGLRTDEEVKLTNVPTLFKFIGKKCVGRLVEGDCTNDELLNKFLSA